MNFSEPFIARPVGTLLLALAVLLAGWLGYRLLPVSSLPEVDFPTIQVTTRLPGAGPDTIEALITTPLEQQLGQIGGLTLMSSSSSPSLSTITLQFILNRNIDAVGQDVQGAINAAGGSLPANLPYPPIYRKVNPADQPILVLGLRSDTQTIPDLTDFADTILAQKLSEVSGVGAVTILGGQKPAVRVQVNPVQLAAYGLSLEDVRTALTRASVNQPKGSLDGPRQSFLIGANDQLLNAESYSDIIIAYRNAAPVRLRDIGSSVPGPEDAKLGAWYDGRPAVVLSVQRQPGANIIGTVDRVQAILPQLRAGLPAGTRLTVVSDRTQTIRASVTDVELTLVLTIVLVVMVNFMFLRRFWAGVIPSLALPLSMVATFGVMYLAGFNLDNLSLMALTVGTGFIVDDAIVMVENIVRRVEAGEPPLVAAVKGAHQIGFTIISLTLSLVAVFIPLLFMGGIIGRLFREFALTLSVSIIVSAAVSLTLTPMLCGRLLRPAPGLRWLPRAKADAAGEGGPITHFYQYSLMRVLRWRVATLLVATLALVATIALYIVSPKGFMPVQDTGVIVATTEANAGISVAAMMQVQQRAAAIIGADPDVAAVSSFVGVGAINPTPNAGQMTIVLKPRDARATAEAIATRLRAGLAGLDGMQVYLELAQDIQIGARASRTAYQYVLVDANQAELASWAPRLIARLRGEPSVTNIATDQDARGLAVDLRLDRETMGRLGVTAQAIDDLLYDAFGQRQVLTIYTQRNQYHVVLEVAPEFQADPADLGRLFVPTGKNGQIPLSSLVAVHPSQAPLVITHQGLFPSVTLSFDTERGAALSDAVAAVRTAETAIKLPASVVGTFAGTAAEFQASLANEPWLILAAVICVYVVLGVLYESAIHPLTILSTLPTAGLGALAALRLAGLELSLMGIIAIVLLIGIVKKNAIMMIDFALAAERQGLSASDAIVEACLQRFRPIMMTTVAALLGAIPLALGVGAGSELRRPLGVAIVGGLMFSQLLTLYTTPVVYLTLDRFRRWRPPKIPRPTIRRRMKIRARRLEHPPAG